MSKDAVDELIIAHYGVKGMKWGVRRPRNSKTGRVEKSGGKPKASELSDGELKSAIARMELEKRYTQLSNPSQGQSFTQEIMKQVGRQAVSAIAGPQLAAIGKALADR